MRRLFSLVVLVLAGCAAPATAVLPNTGGGISSPAASLAAGEVALPEPSPFDVPPGAKVACGGIGIDATLHGSASDPHLAWLVNDLGTRIEVVWMPGYRARFTPKLEVLDESDEIVLRDGDHITGGCVTAEPGTLLLEWPFSSSPSPTSAISPSGLTGGRAIAVAQKEFTLANVVTATGGWFGRFGKFEPQQVFASRSCHEGAA